MDGGVEGWMDLERDGWMDEHHVNDAVVRLFLIADGLQEVQ